MAAQNQNNAALTAAFENIANILQTLQNQGGQPPPNQPPQPTLTAFTNNTPFNLDSRAGATAFKQSSSPLDFEWDGSIQNFPPFMLALRSRAQEVKWGAPLPHGILTYAVPTGLPVPPGMQPVTTNRNLLTEYHTITEDVVEAARTARIDDRAIQNSTAMYKCLTRSITGDLSTTMFDQDGNMLSHHDGPSLLMKLLSFTMASSIQLSIQTVNQINNLEPADYQFNIPNINSKINHLFILATTGHRTLSDGKKMQHILTTYAKIKQPVAWAQWIQAQMDFFDNGQLSNAQAFMNQAVVKFTKISSMNEGFNGRSTSIQEDIVAMMATATAKTKTRQPTKPKEEGGKRPKTPLPPFAKWF